MQTRPCCVEVGWAFLFPEPESISMSVMELTCQSSCVRAAICVPGVASASLAGVILQLASAPLATTKKKHNFVVLFPGRKAELGGPSKLLFNAYMPSHSPFLFTICLLIACLPSLPFSFAVTIIPPTNPPPRSPRPLPSAPPPPPATYGTTYGTTMGQP